jgi:gamma-tubulin complex component 2
VAASSPSCPPCSCDCPAPLSLKSIAPGELPSSVPLIRSCYYPRLICVGTRATHNSLDKTKFCSRD